MHSSLTAKFFWFILGLFLLFLLTLYLTVDSSFEDITSRTTARMEESATVMAKLEVRSVVESAMGIMDYYRDRVEQGVMTRQQAEKEMLSALTKIRYADGRGYVWVQKGTLIVMHPVNAKFNGKDMADAKDFKGHFFFRELAAAASNPDGGYVQYWSVKPGSSAPSLKLSYIKTHPYWQLAVASGDYIDVVASMVKKMESDIQQARIGFMHKFLLILFGLGFIMAVLFYFVVRRLLIVRLQELEDNLQQLASGEGDLTMELTVSSNDEIGEVASTLNEFIRFLRSSIRSMLEVGEQLDIQSDDLKKESDALKRTSERFISEIQRYGRVVSEMMEVNQEAEEHARTGRGTVDSLRNSVTNMEQSISVVASSAEEMSSMVSTVAAAVEEMDVSVRTVNESIQQVEQSIGTATTQAEHVVSQMDELMRHSDEIGNITSLIEDISDQTNLLALNATIEAASAGEAGKGFAVVASEIKELARQTVKATDEIDAKIQEMQKAAYSAMEAVKEISLMLTDTSDVNVTVARSMNELQTTSTEISMSMSQTAEAAGSVAREVMDMTQVAQALRDVATEVQNATEGILEMVDRSSAKGQELQSAFSTLRDLMDHISFNIEHLNKYAEDTRRSAAELHEETAKFRV